MNPISVETFLFALILANAFVGVIFIAHQKMGHDFLSAFDRSCAWGGGLFVSGYCLDAIAYAAQT